jgi:HEAT repeat protein
MARVPVRISSFIIPAVMAVTFGVGCGKSTSTLPSTRPAWAQAPDYPRKVQKITRLLETAPTSQPSSADVAELIDQALHDPDFRIRVRAIVVLPYLRNRQRVIDVLITCTHDRDPATTGDGNVPVYATNSLADMAATRAIPDIVDWLNFLKANPNYDKSRHDMIFEEGIKDLRRLTQAAATRPTS